MSRPHISRFACAALLAALLTGCATEQRSDSTAASGHKKAAATAIERPSSVKKPHVHCAKGTVEARLKCLVPSTKKVQVRGSGKALDVTITVSSGASLAPFGVDAMVHGENQTAVRAAAKVFGQSSVQGLSIIGVGPAQDKYGNTSTQPLWVWGSYHGHFSQFNLNVLEMKTLWDAADKADILLS